MLKELSDHLIFELQSLLLVVAIFLLFKLGLELALDLLGHAASHSLNTQLTVF